MAGATLRARIGRFVLVHEQRLKVLYVVAASALVAFIVADRAGLGWADEFLRAHESRWVRRVERGEALTAAGRYDEAVEYLSKLDHGFPARHIKHALGRQRERLLVALGTACGHAGRRRLERDAFERLVQFDPRNFANHFAQAKCLLRQELPDEALEPLRRCLEINPSYLPAVVARIDTHFVDYKYRDIAKAFREYLDAFLMSPVDIDFGGAVVTRHVLADGRFHEVDVPSPAGPAKSVRVRCAEHAVELNQCRVWRPKLVGHATFGDTAGEIDPAAWRAVALEVVRPRVYAPAGEAGWLALDPTSAGDGIVRMNLRLRVLRPVDRRTLDRVARSLHNLPDAAKFDIEPDRLYVMDSK